MSTLLKESALAIKHEPIHAQEDAEQGGADALEALLADADEVTISENDAVQNISATFDLMKSQISPQKRQRWWERVFHRRRREEF